MFHFSEFSPLHESPTLQQREENIRIAGSKVAELLRKVHRHPRDVIFTYLVVVEGQALETGEAAECERH